MFVYFLWSFLLLLSVINDGHTETIMLRELKNPSHVVCITNNTESSILLDPPTEDDNSTNPVQLKLDLPDEWKLTYSNNYSDMKIKSNEYLLEIDKDGFLQIPLSFSELVFSMSISSGAEVLEFYLDDDDYMEMSSIRLNDRSWNNYTVKLKDREMTLFQNETWLKHVTNFIPTKLTIISNDHSSFHYKIFNDNFYYTETFPSEPTKISVENCTVLYISTCPNCYLNVSNVDMSNEEYSYLGNETWTEVILNRENTQYHLHKGINGGNSTNRYWKIRATQCLKNIEKNAIKEFSNSVPNQKCVTLKDKMNQEYTYPSEWNLELLRSQYEAACRNLFGEAQKDCQGYEICGTQGFCTCPLGYKGPYCEQNCGESEWGFNCSQNCTCSDCDNFTGECTTTILNGSVPFYTVIVLATLIIIGAIALAKIDNSNKFIETIKNKMLCGYQDANSKRPDIENFEEQDPLQQL